MAEAMQRDYRGLSSLAKRMTNYSQEGRGLAHVTYFCMRNCGLRKILLLHAIKCGQQFDQLWTSVARTFDGFNLLQMCMYNTLTTNLLSGIWALPCTYVLITNILLHYVEMYFNISRNVPCLGITLGVQPDMVFFYVSQSRAVYQR